MIFFSDATQLFLPSSVYVTAVLFGLTLFALFRTSSHNIHRWRLVFLGLFIWTYISSAPIVSNLLILSFEKNYSRPAHIPETKSTDTVIIVLASGRVRDTPEGTNAHPDEAGWARAIAGIELWKRVGGKILFNGGPVARSGTSVAGRMADLARQQGIPDANIIVDMRANNTYENILYSLDFIKMQNREIWLVTSALHMKRAMRVAKKLSMNAIPYPCDFRANTSLGWKGWFPHNNSPKDLESVLHEFFGIVAYRIRGWI